MQRCKNKKEDNMIVRKKLIIISVFTVLVSGCTRNQMLNYVGNSRDAVNAVFKNAAITEMGEKKKMQKNEISAQTRRKCDEKKSAR